MGGWAEGRRRRTEVYRTAHGVVPTDSRSQGATEPRGVVERLPVCRQAFRRAEAEARRFAPSSFSLLTLDAAANSQRRARHGHGHGTRRRRRRSQGVPGASNSSHGGGRDFGWAALASRTPLQLFSPQLRVGCHGPCAGSSAPTLQPANQGIHPPIVSTLAMMVMRGRGIVHAWSLCSHPLSPAPRSSVVLLLRSRHRPSAFGSRAFARSGSRWSRQPPVAVVCFCYILTSADVGLLSCQIRAPRSGSLRDGGGWDSHHQAAAAAGGRRRVFLGARVLGLRPDGWGWGRGHDRLWPPGGGGSDRCRDSASRSSSFKSVCVFGQ
jgi:hypothetical protein